MGGALSSPSQSSASGAQPSPLQPQGKAFTPKSTQKRLTSTQPLSSHGKEEAVAPPKMSLLAQDISATPTGFPSGPTTSSQGQQVRPEEGEKGQWLLVFGFKRSEESEVLAELQACGDVVARHKPSEDANFMYVQLASKDGVERASGLHGKAPFPHCTFTLSPIVMPVAWLSVIRQGGGGEDDVGCDQGSYATSVGSHGAAFFCPRA